MDCAELDFQNLRIPYNEIWVGNAFLGNFTKKALQLCSTDNFFKKRYVPIKRQHCFGHISDDDLMLELAMTDLFLDIKNEEKPEKLTGLIDEILRVEKGNAS